MNHIPKPLEAQFNAKEIDGPKCGALCGQPCKAGPNCVERALELDTTEAKA